MNAPEYHHAQPWAATVEVCGRCRASLIWRRGPGREAYCGRCGLTGEAGHAVYVLAESRGEG